MSSPKPKDGSPSQNDPSKPIPILDITKRLDKLLITLTEAKSIVPQVQEDGKKDGDNSRTDADNESKKGGENLSKKKGGEMNMYNQLDKACKELNYMINEFKKLEDFEADISKPLDTLEDNVKDIVTDLDQLSAVSVKQLIERNLKVLRSNITKVKIQIPLQHQVSGTVSKARGYLQTTAASKEVGYLPNPYEAKEIFESGSFVKEFHDHYKALDNSRRLCLLCFAIFPENAEVKKRLLRFWWVGERLNSVPGSDTDTEKGFVNKSLREFVEMGFIEPVTKKSRSQATSYKMHPIIRSFIIKLAEEANFFDYDSKGNPTMDISASKKSCLVKSSEVKSKGMSSWFSKHVSQPDRKQQPKSVDNQQKEKKQRQEEEQKRLDNQQKEKKQRQEEEQKRLDNQQKEKKQRQEEEQKRLDNQQKKKKQRQKEEEEEEEKQRIRLEKLMLKKLDEIQTLFNVSKQFPDLPVERFSKMRNIGVLYLGRWESTAERHIEVENSEFLTGLENMKKLRFFSLQGISGISKLEVSLCKLTNLRILDLRACHNLEELPKEIGSLKKLTDLDLSECYLLDKMPKQLSQLSTLKVLKGFVISKNKSSCTLDKLAALHNLEKLSINVNSDKFSINEEEHVFFKFTALQKLKIAWGAGAERAAKPTNGNGGKKGNGNQESSRYQKNQERDTAAKSGATMALRKLKMPWGACGEGSSKSIAEIKGTAAAEKSGEVVKTQESGLKLVKLDIQCFPGKEPPRWLVPQKLTSLKRLYIRGGELSNLGESSMPDNKEQWEVETLRLKFLTDFKTNWKELQTQFPKLKYLEKVKCPQITFCPCDANGVWMLKQP